MRVILKYAPNREMPINKGKTRAEHISNCSNKEPPERYSFRNDRKTYYAAPDFDNNCSQDVYNEYISNSGLGKDFINAYFDKELQEYFKVKSFDDFISNQLNCTTATKD